MMPSSEHLARAAAEAEESIRLGLPPPIHMTISDWADRYRILSPESSAEPGPWRTSRVSYLREIMDTLGDPLVRKVVWVASSQSAKTELLNNYVGHSVDQNPGPILVVQPSLEMAKTWSKDRLAPMIRDTPCLRGKVADAKARHSGNTVLHKVFPAGHLSIVGANSPTGLASRPIRDVLFDEVDRYPSSVGTEGDPLSLGEQRTRNFWNRKILYVSSPGDLETSRIWPEWLASDMRRYFVPCPHCDHYQVLVWKGVRWESEEVDGETVYDPATAVYVCEECGSIIEEIEKRRMLEEGEWHPTNPRGRSPGFHISALYSPWVTWAELAALWLEKKRSQEELQTFVNLQLGEPWEERDQTFEPTELASTAKRFPAEIPNGVGLLTASVDVQDDRLEVAVKGWGEGEESWLITHERLHGDPEQDEVWQELEHMLTKTYRHESGRSLRIRATMIDSGYLQDRVFRFIRGKEGRGIYASKGADSRVREALQRAKRPNRSRVKPWTINVHAFKTIIFRRLALTASREEPGGPGYMHFCAPTKTGADAEYFAQFGAETRKKVRQGRRFVYAFVQHRDRNEAIDLEVYALAALYALGDPLVKRLGKMADVLGEPVEEGAEEKAAPRPAPRRKKNWATGWKT